MTNVVIETNRVDPDQTAPTGAGFALFDQETSKTFQQTTKQATFVVIYALRVKI